MPWRKWSSAARCSRQWLSSVESSTWRSTSRTPSAGYASILRRYAPFASSFARPSSTSSSRLGSDASHFDSGSSRRSSPATTFSSPGMSHCSSTLSSGTRAQQIGDLALTQRLCLVRHVLRLEYRVPQLVDLAALVVGDVVVFEQLLADVEVVSLDLALRAFDRACHQAVLDRLAFGHAQALHDGVDPLAGEDPQKRILEGQVEARGARVSLAPGAAAQLVVDAARLVPLGPDDVQPARSDDLVVQVLPLVPQLRDPAFLLRVGHLLLLLQEI